MTRFMMYMTFISLLFFGIVGCSEGNSTNSTSDNDSEGGEDVENQEDVSLKLFTGKVETVDLMDELIADFESANPNIQVEQEYANDASNVMKVKFASGDVPDITTVITQDYMDQDRYIDLSDESYWDRILPSIKELNTDIKTGNTFSVATNVTMAGIFYNKEIFAELGLEEAQTWDEFVSNLETIKEEKPDVTPLFLPGKEVWSLGHLVEFMAHGEIKQELGISDSRKAFIENEKEKLGFSDPEGPMAIFAERLMELQDKGLINEDALTASYDNQKDAFVTGNAAMISQGMWVMGELLDIDPEVAGRIGFSPYPPLKEGSKPVVLSAEDSKYAITSASEHPEEAKKFLEFLMKDENVKKYSEAIKSPPSFTDVDADWGPIKDETNAVLESAVNIQFTDWPSGFSGDDNGRMVQELLAGKYDGSDLTEFAQEYAETWNKAWESTQ
ncbi:extracellular solute-binding protein [Gracilibacillus sp. YIM 98692]|uniref:ABC transporter substrate-binding protein n=1 Tax=Gracilibacillus sp. YIM 98692 TaxID=2663532 RepID=UPI0013D8301E|nr:extracellular solute-binding protein [Gracilibacillus sp. YIM 98692]